MNFSNWYTQTHNDWWHDDYLNQPVFAKEIIDEYRDWCADNQVEPVGIPALQHYGMLNQNHLPKELTPMNEQVKTFLEDTRDILTDYDGAKTVEQLKALIDETAARINAATTGTIKEYEDNL